MALRHIVRLFLVTAIALSALRGTPARAQEACFGTLRICYARAAFADTFLSMWLAGLDCEIDYADCIRRAIVGR